jgi:hypothetical protein
LSPARAIHDEPEKIVGDVGFEERRLSEPGTLSMSLGSGAPSPFGVGVLEPTRQLDGPAKQFGPGGFDLLEEVTLRRRLPGRHP